MSVVLHVHLPCFDTFYVIDISSFPLPTSNSLASRLLQLGARQSLILLRWHDIYMDNMVVLEKFLDENARSYTRLDAQIIHALTNYGASARAEHNFIAF